MNAESEVDAAQALASKLSTLLSDKPDKQRRLEVLKSEYKQGNYDDRIAAYATSSRTMEAERDGLTIQMRALSAQADTRAKLDLKRVEVTNKTSQMQTTFVILLSSGSFSDSARLQT